MSATVRLPAGYLARRCSLVVRKAPGFWRRWEVQGFDGVRHYPARLDGHPASWATRREAQGALEGLGLIARDGVYSVWAEGDRGRVDQAAWVAS